MKKPLPLIAFAACLAAFAFPGAADAVEQPVRWGADDLEAEVFEGRLARLVLTGRVFFESGDLTLNADRAIYNPVDNTVRLEGDVRLFLPGGEISADWAEYGFDRGIGWTGPAGFSAPPLFGRAERVEITGPGQFMLYEGFVSNCYEENPPVRIRVRRIEIAAGDYARARSLSVMVGRVPVLYLPRLTYSLAKGTGGGAPGFPFSVRPHYGSRDGFELFTTTRLAGGREQYALKLDWRGRRGFGGGLDLSSVRWGETSAETYFIPDRRDDRNRYRVEIAQRRVFPEAHNGLLLGGASLFSDRFFLEDLARREQFRRVNRGFLYYGAAGGHAHAGVIIDGEIDDWLNETRRLPFLARTSLFRPAGGLFYRDDLSLGWFSRSFDGERRTTARANLAPEISLSRPLAGGVARPFLGVGLTAYSEDRRGQGAARVSGEAGVNLEWRFARDYPARDDARFRHFLEPRFTVRRREVSAGPGRFLDYDAVDRLDDDLLVSLQVLNRLEKNRGTTGGEVVRLDLEADYSLDRDDLVAARGRFSFNPSPFVQAGSVADYHPGNDAWQTLLNYVAWENGRTRVDLRHIVQGRDENRLATLVSFPLGERYQVEAQVHYNILDGAWEKREISVTRAFHCWKTKLTLYRDRDETEVYVSFEPIFFAAERLPRRGRD